MNFGRLLPRLGLSFCCWLRTELSTVMAMPAFDCLMIIVICRDIFMTALVLSNGRLDEGGVWKVGHVGIFCYGNMGMDISLDFQNIFPFCEVVFAGAGMAAIMCFFKKVFQYSFHIYWR